MTGPAPLRSTSHLPVLDGLRAIAVLLVLWQHVPETLPGYPDWLRLAKLIGPGGLGVHVFFVLSGFLITRILLAERERSVPLWRFMVRRLLRIFPIYYLLLAVLWVVQGGSEGLAWCAVYLSNFWFVFGGPETANAANVQHTWSLCIEEHFYLLWPLVVAFLPRETARRLLVFAILPLAVASAPLGWLFVAEDRFDEWTMHSSTVQFLHLGLGCLLAFGERDVFLRPRRYLALGFAALGAGALCSGVVYALVPHVFFGEQPWIPLAYWPLMDVAYTALVSFGAVVIAVAARDAWALRWLAWSPMRGIGRISYGLYLYHLPVFYWLLHPAPSMQTAGLAIVVTFAIATASYFVVERPILRYGARFR